jgi:phosphate starvation-inducible PhoH-like protein
LRKKNNNKVKKPIDITNNLIPKTEDLHFNFRNRLKPKTSNQKDYIRTVAENTITFCQGLAGTGKTHIAIGMALEYLSEQKIKKIIITRPVIEAGEKIGYLPGTAEEKIHPYLLPILDEINHFISPQLYNSLKINNQIEIVPLGLMRGRSFHESFIVADECQNATYEQLKMLLTRIGRDSKMVITGDIRQSDLNKHLQGGYKIISHVLNNVNHIGFTYLESSDIIRNPIIADIMSRIENYECQET